MWVEEEDIIGAMMSSNDVQRNSSPGANLPSQHPLALPGFKQATCPEASAAEPDVNPGSSPAHAGCHSRPLPPIRSRRGTLGPAPMQRRCPLAPTKTRAPAFPPRPFAGSHVSHRTPAPFAQPLAEDQNGKRMMVNGASQSHPKSVTARARQRIGRARCQSS